MPATCLHGGFQPLDGSFATRTGGRRAGRPGNVEARSRAQPSAIFAVTCGRLAPGAALASGFVER